jgi:hypothetical protein
MKQILICLSLCVSMGNHVFSAVGDDKSKDRVPLKPPEGWKHDKFGDKAVLVGPTHEGFRANINLTTEIADLPLAKYVDDATAAVQKVLPNLKVLKKGEFKTTAGLVGVKCECSNVANGIQLRQTFYVFEAANGKKLVFTCSAHATKGDELAPIFDSIIKTYAP